MIKPLVLVSPNNAKSVALDLALLAGACVIILNPTELLTLLSSFGSVRWVSAWALGLVLSCFSSALAAVSAAVTRNHYRLFLRAEAVADFVTFLLLGIYAWLLYRADLTAIGITALTVGNFCRVLQVMWDLHKDSRANKNPRTIVQKALADPHEK